MIVLALKPSEWRVPDLSPGLPRLRETDAALGYAGALVRNPDWSAPALQHPFRPGAPRRRRLLHAVPGEPVAEIDCLTSTSLRNRRSGTRGSSGKDCFGLFRPVTHIQFTK